MTVMAAPRREAALLMLTATPASAWNSQASLDAYSVATATGAGSWFDPGHYIGPHSFAGTRYIAMVTEVDPQGTLTMVGSDDGAAWWKVSGSYQPGGKVTFDFSPRGGPVGLNGTWAAPRRLGSASAAIVWEDGNSWWRLAEPPTPPAPFGAGATDDHVGVFRDLGHYVAGSFSGLRFISEDPPHALTVVGSDDGFAWWSLQGSCSGELMTTMTVDFSPKGGPPSLSGRWEAPTDAPGRLVWPDGNAWTKVSNTPCPDCPWAPESTPSALLEAPEEHEAEHGGEEHEEARPCVRGVCVVHHEEGGEHGEEAHEEHEPRLWWQPFEREHYYAPTESFQLHVITIAIFAMPAAGIAYYLNTQPRLKRMLCVM